MAHLDQPGAKIVTTRPYILQARTQIQHIDNAIIFFIPKMVKLYESLPIILNWRQEVAAFAENLATVLSDDENV